MSQNTGDIGVQGADLALRAAQIGVEVPLKAAQITADILLKSLQVAAKTAESTARLAKGGIKSGKQAVKRLSKEGKDLVVADLESSSAKSFKKHLSKYGIDFAILRNPATKERIAVYKITDTAVVEKAVKSYIEKEAAKGEKKSVKATIKEAKNAAKSAAKEAKAAAKEISSAAKAAAKKGKQGPSL